MSELDFQPSVSAFDANVCVGDRHVNGQRVIDFHGHVGGGIAME